MFKHFAKMSALTALALTALGTPAAACGADSDCVIDDGRVYRIHLPPEIKHPGAIVFAHGYRGSAKGIMRSNGFKALADRLGVPLIAAQAYAQDWRIPGVPADPSTDGALEYGYFANLKQHLADTYDIDPAKTLFTGFSAGGMMVWQLACFRGDTFGAYAPIAGTFWDPMPTSCPSAPVSLLHTHGSSDKIVPMTGRFVTANVSQGDVNIALDLLTTAGGYGPRQPIAAPDKLTCEGTQAPGGALLQLCMHPGGHSVSAAYVDRAWDALVKAGKF